MEFIPDDVFLKILLTGVENEQLDHADLCSLAIVSKHFDQLTQDPSLWATLFSRDFRFSFRLFFEVPSKALYKEEHERRAFNRIGSSFQHLHNQLDEEFSLLEPLLFFPRRYQLSPLRRIPYGSSSGSEFSHLETQLNSGTEANFVNVIVGGIQDYLTFHEEGDPVLSHANQPTLSQGRNRYDENKSRKRFNKMSRPKVIPNCKSYIPMNRPPRRCMARKI